MDRSKSRPHNSHKPRLGASTISDKNLESFCFIIYSPTIFQSQWLYVPTTVRIISTDSCQYPEIFDGDVVLDY